MAAELDAITLDRKDGIGVIRINRPEKANSLRYRDYELLRDRIREVDEDDEVRVIVLTAAGDKHFTVGDDWTDYASPEVSRFRDMPVLERHRLEFPLIDAGRRLWNSTKPSIAAINGACVLPEILWWCDFRVMAEHATIVERNVRVGISAGCGGTQLVVRLFGRATAMRVMLVGEPIDATEAFRLGLVHEVVPKGQVLGAAERLAGSLLESPATAVAMTKLSVNAAQEASLEWGMQVEKMGSYLSELTGDIWKVAESFMSQRGDAAEQDRADR